MIEIELPVAPLAAEPGTLRAGNVVDDDAAFASWYRNEHPRLLAAMVIVTNDMHVAQDVTAEAFARALAAWNRVSNMESPTGWTYRVALNVARRRARRVRDGVEGHELGGQRDHGVAAFRDRSDDTLFQWRELHDAIR